jgi:hypothetical protein
LWQILEHRATDVKIEGRAADGDVVYRSVSGLTVVHGDTAEEADDIEAIGIELGVSAGEVTPEGLHGDAGEGEGRAIASDEGR